MDPEANSVIFNSTFGGKVDMLSINVYGINEFFVSCLLYDIVFFPSYLSFKVIMRHKLRASIQLFLK